LLLRAGIDCIPLEVFYFFFSSRRRHTIFSRDWSSDVCSSDLVPIRKYNVLRRPRRKKRLLFTKTGHFPPLRGTLELRKVTLFSHPQRLFLHVVSPPLLMRNLKSARCYPAHQRLAIGRPDFS